MKFIKRLEISSLYDNVHFLFILIVLLILALKHWIFIFGVVLYLFFIYKKTPLFSIGVFLASIILVINISYLFEFNKTTFSGVVVECDKDKAVINSSGSKVLIYHKNSLSLGDYGEFVVTNLDYDTELFSYSDYLLNKGIKNYYKLSSFEFEKNYFVLSKIKAFFLEKLQAHPSSYKLYINTLIFADKKDLSITEAATNLGVSHLLAVSGMHISLLLFFLELILRKFFYFSKHIDVLLIIFLLFYLVVTNFELTVLRAALMKMLSLVFKNKKILFTQLDILSIVGIIMLLFNPRSLFLLSFQLSFLVSFIIIIFAKNFNFKSKIVQTYFISFVSFLVTLPFIINANYEINILTVLVGPVYVLYFELLLYPITLVLYFIPQTYFILDYVFSFFEISLRVFDSLRGFNLIFGKLSSFSFILYEVILYFLLVSFEIKRGRKLLSFIMFLFLFLLYNKALFNPFYKVKMYDVGQGESILIELPHNRGNILIDCYNNVVSHLKRDGIKKVDLVFLSHGHEDHIGAYMELVSVYSVRQTYSSFYDNSKLLNDLKKKKDIYLLRGGDKVIYKEFICDVLGPIKYYDNENNNSLVFKVYLDGLTILFTGDIEKEVEHDLINRYGTALESDILKVAHHGSKTSSTLPFLKLVNPKHLLVSVGKNNQYNFPNNKDIMSFNNLYRTDLFNSITFYKRKKIFYIEK